AFGFTAHIRSRREEAKAIKNRAGFRARRWVVERSHSWMNRFRRILVRWEKRADTISTHLAMTHIPSLPPAQSCNASSCRPRTIGPHPRRYCARQPRPLGRVDRLARHDLAEPLRQFPSLTPKTQSLADKRPNVGNSARQHYRTSYRLVASKVVSMS